MVEEYISKEETLNVVEDWAEEFCECSYVFPHLRRGIKKLPAADVRPVKRGKWEPVVAANEDGSPYQAGIHCSECGNFDVWEFNFCPNCGADMRDEN